MLSSAFCLAVALSVLELLPIQDLVVEAAVLRVLDVDPWPPKMRAFVAAKTPKRVPDDRFEQLVRELASRDADTRDAAEDELRRGGPEVVDRLRVALPGATTAEHVNRIKELLSQITAKDWSPRGVAAYRAAVHALARRADPESAPCLLGALPTMAGDDEVLAAAWRALDAVAVRAGAVPAACVAARTDPRAERRAVAAFLLGRRGTAEQRRLAVGLLADPDPGVQLRAAQGLLGAGDLSGVPVLVALLDAKPVPVAWEAEELLVWLAGPAAPAERVGDGRKTAEARRAWERWHKTAKPDWKAAAEAPGRPLLLLVRNEPLFGLPQESFNPTVLVGCDGKVRWKASPPDGRILLVDCVCSTGEALGLSWTNHGPRRTLEQVPALARFPIGGVVRSGPELKLPPGYDSRIAVRRWPAGWTLVAGPERFGFSPAGQNAVPRWASLPRYKHNPPAPEEEVTGNFLGERDGLVWYACSVPSLRNLGFTTLIEPSSGQCPLISGDVFARFKAPRWNEVRVGSAGGVVTAAGGRLCETVGGMRVWEAQMERASMRTVSQTLPLIRFGFDDLAVTRKALGPVPVGLEDRPAGSTFRWALPGATCNWDDASNWQILGPNNAWSATTLTPGTSDTAFFNNTSRRDVVVNVSSVGRVQIDSTYTANMLIPGGSEVSMKWLTMNGGTVKAAGRGGGIVRLTAAGNTMTAGTLDGIDLIVGSDKVMCAPGGGTLTIDGNISLANGASIMVPHQLGGRYHNELNWQSGSIATPATTAGATSGSKIINHGTMRINSNGTLGDATDTSVNRLLNRRTTDGTQEVLGTLTVYNTPIVAGGFRNDGLLFVRSSAKLTVQGAAKQTDGTTELRSGTITASLYAVDAGSLFGNGTIDGNLTLGTVANAAVTLSPGYADGEIGTIAITQSMQISSNKAVTKIRVTRAGASDKVVVQGGAQQAGWAILHGTLSFDIASDYNPAQNTAVTFLSAPTFVPPGGSAASDFTTTTSNYWGSWADPGTGKGLLWKALRNTPGAGKHSLVAGLAGSKP